MFLRAPAISHFVTIAKEGEREEIYRWQLLCCRISNPLAGLPVDTILRDVEKFAEEKGLTEHLHLLKKGALVQRDPDNYEDITGEFALDHEEIAALRSELNEIRNKRKSWTSKIRKKIPTRDTAHLV